MVQQGPTTLQKNAETTLVSNDQETMVRLWTRKHNCLILFESVETIKMDSLYKHIICPFVSEIVGSWSFLRSKSIGNCSPNVPAMPSSARPDNSNLWIPMFMLNNMLFWCCIIITTTNHNSNNNNNNSISSSSSNSRVSSGGSNG